MKRIGSILLALALLCSGAPLVAAAEPQPLTQTVALLQEGQFPPEAVRSDAPAVCGRPQAVYPQPGRRSSRGCRRWRIKLTCLLTHCRRRR